MPHRDGLPLVFQFPKEDTQPESQEHKALWDELELALREDAVPVPAPVPALVVPTAPAPIPVALMAWEPHIMAELEATGFHEVPADFHVPVHLPAHATARALTCAPVLVPVYRNVSAAPLPAPMLVPPSAAWIAAIDRFLAPTRVTSSRQFTVSWRPKSRTFWPSLKLGPTSRSKPTTAQDAAVVAGQWPNDTQSTAQEPLPTARHLRHRRMI
jgi:hypothetical protein